MAKRGNKKVYSLYENWLQVPTKNEVEERLMLMPAPFDDETLKRSDYNPLYYGDNLYRNMETGNPWCYHYPKVATQAIFPLNCYRASAEFQNPPNPSCPETGTNDVPSGALCFNTDLNWVHKTRDCLDTGNPMSWVQILSHDWTEGVLYSGFSGSSISNTTSLLPCGPYLWEGEGFGDAYRVSLQNKCSRVFVYDKITHNGTTYETGKLATPDFVLRPRNYKEWPRYVSGAWTTGLAWADSPTGVLGLQPFSYFGDYGIMKYDDHFVSTMNGQSLVSPPNWNLVDYSGLPEAGDLNKINGERVLDLFKYQNAKFNKDTSAFQTMTSSSFLDEIPTGIKHQLVIEAENYTYTVWRNYRKEKLYPPGHPNEGEVDWYSYKWRVVETGYYNTHGRAYALL